MYAIAKAMALDAGVRFIDLDTGEVFDKPKSPRCMAAYGLTMAELRGLYAENGFSVKGNGLTSHLDTWDYSDWIYRIGKDSPWIFFKNCNRDRVFDALKQAIPSILVIA